MSDADPWYPQEPKEQQDAAQIAESRITASLPVIQDVLDWLDSTEQTYRDVMTIEGVNPSSKPEDIKTAVILAQSRIRDTQELRDRFTKDFARYLEPADAA